MHPSGVTQDEDTIFGGDGQHHDGAVAAPEDGRPSNRPTSADTEALIGS